MNDYSFLGHLVKAIGYAVVGAGEDDDQGIESRPTTSARRRTSAFGVPSRGNKKCCTAKRPGATAPAGGKTAATAGAPAASASFGRVPSVRPGNGQR
jgi:hypothetical protein